MALAYDIPVLSSGGVADVAVSKACKLVEFMISDRADLRKRLIYKRKKFAVLGEYEVIKGLVNETKWHMIEQSEPIGGNIFRKMTKFYNAKEYNAMFSL